MKPQALERVDKGGNRRKSTSNKERAKEARNRNPQVAERRQRRQSTRTHRQRRERAKEATPKPSMRSTMTR